MRKEEELDTIDAVRPDEPVVPPRVDPPVATADTIDAKPHSNGAAVAAQPNDTDYVELLEVERSHYQIAGELAKGGMGRVLDARDLRLGRDVAIKVLQPQHRDAAQQRFEREARITARLQHPAIIHVYEAGKWAGGEPFYVMPKVNGRRLDKVVAEKNDLTERLGLVPNVIAVADALAYAHNENVIHRDLKPSNVLVGRFGETVVIDWGLAKDLGAPFDPVESLRMPVRRVGDETSDGSVVGTPAYMPPEQARGRSVDQRADVYSLGAVLYHVLVGRAPYSGESSDDVLEQVKSERCVPVHECDPGVPRELVAIVEKAMARAAADRYPDAGELAADLKRFQTGQLVAAHHYTSVQLFGRWLRRFRVPVIIAAIAMIALALFAWVSFTRILEEKSKATRQEQISTERRNTLLEERGREELLAGRAGRAAVNLVGVARDLGLGGTRGFLIAEAIRPFDAQIAALESTGASAHTVAFSPDGKHIATATDAGIQLWSRDGVAEVLCARPAERTNIVAFDPSGTRILAAGDSGVVRIWTLDGTLVRELRDHGGPILDADWNRNGMLVGTASADRTVRVWNAATGKVIDILGPPRPPNDKPPLPDAEPRPYHEDPVVSIRFSPIDDRVATADQGGSAFVWANLEDPITLETQPLRCPIADIKTIRWSPDARSVVIAGSNGAKICSTFWGKPVGDKLGHSSGVNAAVFSPDGRFVLTASDDRSARMWLAPEVPPPKDEHKHDIHITEEQQRATIRQVRSVAATDAVVTAVFSSDASLIATTDRDDLAKVWAAESGQLIASYEHAGIVDAIFSPDRTRLLTTATDGKARLWDIARGGVGADSYTVDSPIHGIAISGNTVAAAADDSYVRILEGGQVALLHGHNASAFAVAFSPDGSQLASGGLEGLVHVTVMQTRFTLHKFPHDSAVNGIAYHPNGREVATATDDGNVRIWSTETGLLARTLRYTTSRMLSVAYSPDGTIVAGVTADGEIVLWTGDSDVGRGERLTHSRDTALAFRPDGSFLAVGGSMDTRLYPMDRGRIVKPGVAIDGPTGDVTVVAWTADGSCVITGSKDGIAKIWDAGKGKQLGVRGGDGHAITALAVTGSKLWVATDNTVRAWDIHFESRPLAAIVQTMERVPWRLDPDDTVRPKAASK